MKQLEDVVAPPSLPTESLQQTMTHSSELFEIKELELSTKDIPTPVVTSAQILYLVEEEV